MTGKVRDVRAVMHVNHCNCLRAVIAGGARVVREMIAQVIEIIAGGKAKSAAARALVLRTMTGPAFWRGGPVLSGVVSGGQIADRGQIIGWGW